MKYKELKKKLIELDNKGKLSNVQLYSCAYISDYKNFLESHFIFMDVAMEEHKQRKRTRNKLYEPYYSRLLDYYNLMIEN